MFTEALSVSDMNGCRTQIGSESNESSVGILQYYGSVQNQASGTPQLLIPLITSEKGINVNNINKSGDSVETSGRRIDLSLVAESPRRSEKPCAFFAHGTCRHGRYRNFTHRNVFLIDSTYRSECRFSHDAKYLLSSPTSSNGSPQRSHNETGWKLFKISSRYLSPLFAL